jgi:hypothetical protein
MSVGFRFIVGGLLGIEEFPATRAGYGRLPGCLGGFGAVALVGIEGTGSYGAGLARHVTAAGGSSRRAAPTSGLASLRPRPGGTVGYATRIGLRELGRRAEFPGRPARAARRAHRPDG